MNGESPRGQVLVGAALLDSLLEQSILTYLVDVPKAAKLLEGFNAPLGTFSARAIAALGLGLVSQDEFEDLDTIRKIRNEFAHKTNISFADDCIQKHTQKLKHTISSLGPQQSANGRFKVTIAKLTLRLTARLRHIPPRRLKYTAWPD
nr:MltR family transcriptional regulator [Acidocella aromatica]